MANTAFRTTVEQRLAHNAAGRLYSTRAAARELGLSAVALSLAERRGAIPKVPREQHGPARIYTEADIARLKSLIVAGRLGRR